MSFIAFLCSHTGLEDVFDVMQPGGAGVQYYIGNAQCKACRGLGFEPCPICVGYEAKLTPPNPSEGPASLDDLDRRISTMRWLRGFPDSRARKARRYATSAVSKSSHPISQSCCFTDFGVPGISYTIC